jgi:hypothetical protein
MARKKINVGDWIITQSREIRIVDCVWDDGAARTGSAIWTRGRFKPCPASPATLTKSHRLLMRWYRRAVKDVSYTPVPWDRDVLKHCRRIAKDQRKAKGGRGRE